LVGGTVFGIGSYVGRAILVVVALILAAARYMVDRRSEDDRFTLR
jgi:hypothetical protein